MLIAIYLAPNLANSLIKVAFSQRGIECSLLGEEIRSFSWDSIQQISRVRNVLGMSIGPRIRESQREYCVFIAGELREDEGKSALLGASWQDGAAMIPYNKKLLKRIRDQYEECYCHAKVDVPDLIGMRTKKSDFLGIT